MKASERNFFAIFAVVATLAWTAAVCVMLFIGRSLAGMGDGAPGAGTSHSQLVPLLATLLAIAVIWIGPVTAFIFMFLFVFDKLSGKMRRFAFWYSFVTLIIFSLILTLLLPGFGLKRLIGPFFIFVTVWWWRACGQSRPGPEGNHIVD